MANTQWSVSALIVCEPYTDASLLAVKVHQMAHVHDRTMLRRYNVGDKDYANSINITDEGGCYKSDAVGLQLHTER